MLKSYNKDERKLTKANQQIKGRITVAESAFKGTVLEGRERKYTILNKRDIQKYGNEKDVQKMN